MKSSLLRVPVSSVIYCSRQIMPKRKLSVSKNVVKCKEEIQNRSVGQSVELKHCKVDKTSVAAESVNSSELEPTKSLRSLKFVGAHTSISGGPETAVKEALEIGAKAFALFVRSARTWTCPPLSDTGVEKFKTALKISGIASSKVVVHGSYLINAGAPAQDILEKSRAGMLDEVRRCEKLGIPFYNFHPGSTCGKISVEQCIDRIAESINQVLSQTQNVIILLENMSCQGSTVGGNLTELAQIISKISENQQSRIGVCLDTCHAFAAGNDISTESGWNKFMAQVDQIIGLDRVHAFHLNDSQFAVGAHKDRHAQIGKGLIGLEGFRVLMNDPRTNNLPMVLETDGETFKDEIALLYSLCAE